MPDDQTLIYVEVYSIHELLLSQTGANTWIKLFMGPLLSPGKHFFLLVNLIQIAGSKGQARVTYYRLSIHV